jgi:hypothetical protein
MKPAITLTALLLSSTFVFAAEQSVSISATDQSITIKSNNKEVLSYLLEKPDNKKYPLESACFFHPLRSPSGKVLTDFANADHPHHRGIFLGWVEMHGRKDADFWGWGEPAPIKNRKVVHGTLDQTTTTGSGAGFQVTNDWMAENELLLREKLQANLTATEKANILDLVYTLTTDADLTLARWAFSGFCVRMPKTGKLAISSPDGPANRAAPSHTKPETDWPAAKWYDFTLTFDDNSQAGITLIDNPRNPPSLWHNHRDIRMINPAITAPTSVTIKANEPLILRYRLVAHDGPPDAKMLNQLAEEWK